MTQGNQMLGSNQQEYAKDEAGQHVTCEVFGHAITAERCCKASHDSRNSLFCKHCPSMFKGQDVVVVPFPTVLPKQNLGIYTPKRKRSEEHYKAELTHEQLEVIASNIKKLKASRPRYYKIIEYVADGYSNSMICAELQMSGSYVTETVYDICLKVGVPIFQEARPRIMGMIRRDALLQGYDLSLVLED